MSQNQKNASRQAEATSKGQPVRQPRQTRKPKDPRAAIGLTAIGAGGRPHTQ